MGCKKERGFDEGWDVWYVDIQPGLGQARLPSAVLGFLRMHAHVAQGICIHGRRAEVRIGWLMADGVWR